MKQNADAVSSIWMHTEMHVQEIQFYSKKNK